MATPTNRTPIKLARGSYSNLNSSLDDIQEGEIIYAEDQNKLYVKEGTSLIDVTGSGGGGGTPEGTSILSTGETGTSKFLRIDGDNSCSWQVPPDTNTTYSVGDGGLTQKNFTTTLKTKLDGIASGAEVNVQSDWNSSSGDNQILNKPTVPSSLSDLSDVHNATPSDGQVLKWVNAESRWEPGADSTGGGGGGATNLSNTADGTKLTIESSSGNNTDLPAVTTSAWGVMTDEQLTALNANTAKVTHATHTGDVTGSGALTIADDAVTYAKMQNVSTTDRVLGRDTAGAGNVEEISPASLRTMINVADGANNYTHPAVNHIPAGGSSGQVLKYSSDGTAAWGTDNDTTYSTVSTSAAGLAPTLPGSHGGKFLKADGTWEVPPDTNTQLTEEQVEDFVGGMVTGNTETGITVTYQDADGTLDFAVADQTPEGTAILSTGETGGTKFLREDGDGTCSWQTVSAGGSGEANVQSDWNQTTNTEDDFIKNKPTIPTNNNQLTNGAGFTTNAGTVTNVTGTSPISVSNGSSTPAISIDLSGYSTTSHNHDSAYAASSHSHSYQAPLTFGIANTNAVKIDHATVGSGEYAKFTSSGLEGKTTGELKTDLSLAKADVGLSNVENTAVSTWAGSSNITTLGTVTTLTSSTTTGNSGGSVRKIFYADTGPNPGDGAEGDIWLEY